MQAISAICRAYLSWLLLLLAAGSALFGGAMLAHLPSWAANDRAFYTWIKGVAAYYDREGHLPPKYVQYGPGGSNEGPWVWVERIGGCDPRFTEVPDFKEAPSDHYSLSFWEGDFWECYAVPSGRTTLPMSVANYLKSDTGHEILIYELFSLACACLSILLWPRETDRRLGLSAKLRLIVAFVILISLIDPSFAHGGHTYVYTAGYSKRYVMVMQFLRGPALVIVIISYIYIRLFSRPKRGIQAVPTSR